MKVLVINCGSSSLKFQLIDPVTEEVAAKGLCERIGINGSMISYTPAGGSKIKKEVPMENHTDAIRLVIDALTNEETGVVKDLSEIDAVGHRLVHGAEEFACATLVTPEVKAAIEKCCDLAPLHNPANLIGIEACEKLMPGIPQAGIFDTAFHQTMPEEAYVYGIPYEYYKKYKVRRYGFHGTSHDYVSERAAAMLGKAREDVKVIVCHLGNGSSISAVKNGKCVDTSMGMTPIEGLIMGTRCGDIDAGVIEFIAKKENMNIDQIMKMLNKESGALGISDGFSSDFRDLEDAFLDGTSEDATRAMKAFAYRVAKYIGSYVAAMNGVDAICFTAGVGENSPILRTMICNDYLSNYLGITLNEELNALRGKEVDIATPESKTRVLVIPTNEELAIARSVYQLVK
ncbi:MAG: acetate kinase [Lachnospiraceae bacterium]|nr:acetate kinase [Lachnospiraceae bacterium]